MRMLYRLEFALLNIRLLNVQFGTRSGICLSVRSTTGSGHRGQVVGSPS